MILPACNNLFNRITDYGIINQYFLTLQRWCSSNDPVLLFSKRTGRSYFFYDRLTQVFFYTVNTLHMFPTPNPAVLLKGTCQ